MNEVYLLVYTDQTNVGARAHGRWNRTDRWLLAIIPADEIDELLTHFRS